MVDREAPPRLAGLRLKRTWKLSLFYLFASRRDMSVASRLVIRLLFLGLLFLVMLTLIQEVSCAQKTLDAARTRASIDGYRLVRIWTDRDGLPNNSVTSLAQTEDGFLWIGTRGGLARFDGVEFENYSVVDNPELRSGRIEALATDDSGTLWIGHEGAGINWWRQGRFGPPSPHEVSVAGVAWQFASNGDGRVYWSGKGVGLLGDQTKAVLSGNFDSPDPIRSMALDAEGTVWLGSSIIRQVRADGTWLALDTESDPSWVSTFVSYSPAFGVWGRSKSGYFRLDSNGLVRRLEANDLVLGEHIHQSLRDDDGQEFIATDGGVFAVDIDNHRLSLRPEPADLLGLKAQALLRDREGHLWVGLDGGGLAQCAPRNFDEITLSELGCPGLLPHIASDGQQGFWLGDRSSELLWHWIPGERCEPWDSPAAPRLAGDKMLLGAQDGTLWIRTEEALLTCRDKSIVRHSYPPLGVVVDGGCLHEDRQGRIWCGSVGQLHCFDKTDFKSWSARDGFPLANTPIAFADEPSGGLWLTDGIQVCFFFEGQFTLVPEFDGSNSGTARTLCATDNMLVIGCYGGGVTCVRDLKVTRITSSHGLHDDYVSRIFDDGAGHLWINSNRGVFRILTRDLNDLAAGRARRISSNALMTAEANGNEGGRLTDGRMVFRTVPGWVLIDPRRLLITVAAPKISRFELDVGGTRIDLDREVVVRGSRNLAFRYAAPTFIDPKNTHYEWRLVDYLDDWQSSGEDRVVRLASIPPGKYRFEVRAAVGQGIPGPVVGVDLRIPHKLYETLWFRVLSVSLGLVLLGGAFQLRYHQALRREQALKLEIQRRTALERSMSELSGKLLTVQEDERRRIARDLHDDLNQRLSLLAISLDLLSQRTGKEQKKELMNELQTLARGIQEASQTIRRIAYDLHPVSLEHLGLRDALESLCESLRDRGIQVDFRAKGENRLPAKVELGVYRITQEAVQNIAQHSESQSARIQVEFDPDQLCVTIEDNGKGFDPENVTGGLGLFSMQERAAHLRGSLSVLPQPGTGTRIDVRVPLPYEERQLG